MRILVTATYMVCIHDKKASAHLLLLDLDTPPRPVPLAFCGFALCIILLRFWTGFMFP